MVYLKLFVYLEVILNVIQTNAFYYTYYNRKKG